jgi:peptide/nickel transport system substrate-binding protein
MVKIGKGTMLIIVLVAVFVAYVLFSRGSGQVPAGYVIIAQPADADILDPTRTVYPWAVNVNNLIYESLLTYDWNMNLTPMLAESLPTWNEEGMFYTFKLKHGIKFQCGHPFTAESVVYTINRDKNMPGSKQTESLKNITTAEVIDDYTVRIWLNADDRFLVDWFASSSSVIVCDECAKRYGTQFGTPNGPPCGTGPFKYVEWQAALYITLARYDDYNWGPEMYQNKGPAHLDGVQFRVISDYSTAEAQLERGIIDFDLNVNPNQALFDRWGENNPYNITLYKGAQVGDLVYLGFNCAGEENHGYGYENGALSPGSVSKAVPLKVRQAIAYAINENSIIELAYSGVATPPTSWLAGTIWGSTDYQENMYPYNPEKARELLAEAGYPNGGLNLEVIHWTDPHYDIICTEMIRELENVGITLTTVSLDYNTVEDKIRTRDYNMFIAGYSWPLADMIWWEWHTSRLPSPNRFWWGDNYTDAIINNTWSMNNDVALNALYESQRLIAEDAASIGLLNRGLISAWRSDVKDTQWGTFKIHPIPSEWKFLDTYKSSVSHAVSVTAYPAEDNGSPGSVLNYTVTVTNIGAESDTYTLRASDNAVWSPSISLINLTLGIGEAENVTLSVTIPAGALLGTRDLIIITATSQNDTTISDNTSCIAYVVAS